MGRWTDGRMDNGYLMVGNWADIHIWMDGQMDIPGHKNGSWIDELKKKGSYQTSTDKNKALRLVSHWAFCTKWVSPPQFVNTTSQAEKHGNPSVCRRKEKTRDDAE